MGAILLKNIEAIVTCADDDKIIRNCDMLIEEPKIVEIGQDLSHEGAEIID